MTKPELYKVGGSILVLLLGWYFGKRPRAASGNVELGVPTVIGSGSEELGNLGYYSPRPPEVLVPDGERLAQESEMDRLIRESNAAIAAADDGE